MNKTFIKKNYNMFACDLDDTDNIKVVKYILKMQDYSDNYKRCLIQQYLLNWVTIGDISER